MKRFNRMLARLEISQKFEEPETLYKDLWQIPGGWSNTTRGMLLSMLKPSHTKEVKASYTPPKEDKPFNKPS